MKNVKKKKYAFINYWGREILPEGHFCRSLKWSIQLTT